MNEPIHLVIADDHPAVVLGVQEMLKDADSVVTTGIAHSPSELLRVLSTARCDVVVCDYSMPGDSHPDGIPMFAALQRERPDVKPVVLTMCRSPSLLQELVAFGVRCIISKSDDPSHVLMGIHAAGGGATYMSPGVAALVPTWGAEVWTQREAEVVQLLVEGLTTTEIAARLQVARQTVHARKRSAMTKLGVAREEDLFQYALAAKASRPEHYG
ncbi:response regulator transcription factor [Burkholderia multivorans]|uniref:response regulator transcription factor n=1 Tax=Burkholderia multivorans TaxID=87883 RepID=UPI0020197034|nr:response regulator transcription factor [Burkholderia multivorans]MCO1370226.1 response regulator transcription factor [Burkholderia multivorans]MCO1459525.1 response regulator transcription factor [Burkholderia multivorans]MCO1467510.1 response regulator transcription factor [Burkholderia multivorans]UQO20722.1 response regulator transcription factor [Burkholderia multivorans]UQO84326.1 response regulator transcription factor [Burkholderia multivorans]